MRSRVLSSGVLHLPLVGRQREVETVLAALAPGREGRGGAIVLRGESGVGKSRLLDTISREAAEMGWVVASGRAYPVETDIPYAPIADAFTPLLRSLSPEALATLTRGSMADLARLIPILPRADDGPARLENPLELKARLHWNFSEFLGRFAARQPLLLVIDDVQWADASSIELLHFVSRKAGNIPLLVLAACNDGASDANPQFRVTLSAMERAGIVETITIGALTLAGTGALIHQRFGVEESVTREFTALLHGWTRGNPFFLDETLKTLVERGYLFERDGSWQGWNLEAIDLPPSIRNAVLLRLESLSGGAREVADLLSVIGTSVRHRTLMALSTLSEAELVEMIEELRRHRILDERVDQDDVTYDFVHPAVRETLYGELGLVKARLLHRRVAHALEAHLGAAAMDQAGELAYHFVRGGPADAGDRAIRYLHAAGRAALEKNSNREATNYLGAAVDRLREGGAEPDPGLMDELARALQRQGDFEGAIAIWAELLDRCEHAGDSREIAAVHRRLGLANYWRRDFTSALSHLENGLTAARNAHDRKLEARLHVARGECLTELGKPDDARRDFELALVIADAEGDTDLRARVHVVLLLLHTMTGPPGVAREHGATALALSDSIDAQDLSCSAHWGLAVLEGLSGEATQTAHHIREAYRLADGLHSPLWHLRIAEPDVELKSNIGDWSAAQSRANTAIEAARTLNQRSLLARLLVWSGLIHLGRGEIERGKEKIDEAWELAGGEAGRFATDVHTVVPAHAGLTAYHIATGNFAEAVRIGERGLAIADRSGYTVWAIHRLLPLLAEAYVSAGDLEGAERTGARLRRDSERLGQKLGLAWAEACDALLVWLRGDVAGSIGRIRNAVDLLEAVPAIPDSARLRRHFAARLRDHGDRLEALQELRRCHEVFTRLGAEGELTKTREQIRELGARPPRRESGVGAEGLSAREVEIARLAASGKSNKTIGRTLDISSRTVSTHLSNIYLKLEIGSRAELIEVVRRFTAP